MKRIPALDGVRALAILLVLAFHANTMQLEYRAVDLGIIQHLMDFGWVGVPLFFTLSGFLVGGRMFEQMSEEKFSFSRFYMDRSFRILPVAFLWLALYGAQQGTLGWNEWTFWNFSYLSNRIGVQTPPHYWSLQIEEQFYFLAPVMMAVTVGVLRKDRESLTETFSGLLVLAVPVVCIWRLVNYAFMDHPESYNAFRDGLNYVDFFLTGILAAILYTHEGGQSVKIILGNWSESRGLKAHAPLALVLALYVPMSYLPLTRSATGTPVSEGWQIALVYPILCAWCFVVVLLASVQRNALTKLMGSRPAQVIAMLSYSIYVWHTTVLTEVEALKLSAVPTLLVDVVAVGIISYASYRVIETPFLWMRDKIRAAANPQSVNSSVVAA